MSDEKNYKKYEVQVKFMSPGSRLAGDTYDEAGNKIKNRNEPFTKQDIDALKNKGIEKLYYYPERPKEEIQQESVNNSDVQTTPKANIPKPDLGKFLSDLERRPRILICDFLDQDYDFFIPRLIGNGIAIYRTNDVLFAERYFTKYKITHVLLDIDIAGAKWLYAMNKFKKQNKDAHLFLFYTTVSQDIINLYNDKTLVSNLYNKEGDEKVLIKDVIRDINSSDPYFSKRNHITVLLDANDTLPINIYISKDQVIVGQAYSISPSELSFALSDSLKGEMYNFSVGYKLDRIGLKIYGQIVLTQGEVVKLDIETQIVTVKFSHRSESLLNSIGKFIIDELKQISFES